MLLTALVVSLSSAAAPGVLLGDELRYRRHASAGSWAQGLVLRTLADLVAIPATVPTWQAADWAIAAGVVVPTVGAFVPIDGRSGDAWLQDGVHALRGANCALAPQGSTVCERARAATFHVWTPATNTAIGATLVATPLLLLAASALEGHQGLLEASTLAVEAFFVAQAYHLLLKLVTGREGTLAGTGEGRFFGPTRLTFPDGFPSGHAASLFAVLGAYATFSRSAVVHLVALGVAGVLATWLVLDDYHFASEVFFGATTGFLIGRWIVRHRASAEWFEPASVAPTVSSRGAGVTAVWVF